MSRNGRILGWAHKLDDGTFATFKCVPVFIGTAKDFTSAFDQVVAAK